MRRFGNFGYGGKKRADEAIAAARECFDVERFVGGIGESLTEFVDCFIEAVFEVDEGFLRPEALLNFFTRDDLAGALKEHDEDFERLSGKADF